MHEPKSRPVGKSFFQLGIKSALFLVLLIGLGLGWWSDRGRLARELADSEIQREIQDRQIGILRQTVSSRLIRPSPPTYDLRGPFTTPDHFIERVRSIQSDAKTWTTPLADAGRNYEATVTKLLFLLEDADPNARHNACKVLREQYRHRSRWRIEKHSERVVRDIAEMLKLSDPAGAVTREAIELLAIIGKDLGTIKAALSPIMEDDKHPQAVTATIAWGKVFPRVDVAPRLTELIYAENVEWESAAIALLDHRSAQEVRKILVEFYITRQKDIGRVAVVTLIDRMKL